MRIYLVQHGEAEPQDVDPDRHLTAKGARDVRKVAAFLEPLGLRLGVIWHSGKARAAQTADILGGAVAAAGGIVEREGLAPNDPVGPVRKALESATEDLMIVGHLPFLSRLASALLVDSEEAQVVAFQNGGVVCVERGGDGACSLRWMVTPELLR
jgi:phosphohistidine phosphatase